MTAPVSFTENFARELPWASTRGCTYDRRLSPQPAPRRGALSRPRLSVTMCPVISANAAVCHGSSPAGSSDHFLDRISSHIQTSSTMDSAMMCSHSSPYPIPTAAASCGTRLVGVMPGRVLISRNQRSPVLIQQEVRPTVGLEPQGVEYPSRQRWTRFSVSSGMGEALDTLRSTGLVLVLVIVEALQRDDLDAGQGLAV